jgi:hypothetical protein
MDDLHIYDGFAAEPGSPQWVASEQAAISRAFGLHRLRHRTRGRSKGNIYIESPAAGGAPPQTVDAGLFEWKMCEVAYKAELDLSPLRLEGMWTAYLIDAK